MTDQFYRHSLDANADHRVKWRLAEGTRLGEIGAVTLTVPAKRQPLSLEQFYELREAVNDLYEHIREEQSTD